MGLLCSQLSSEKQMFNGFLMCKSTQSLKKWLYIDYGCSARSRPRLCVWGRKPWLTLRRGWWKEPRWVLWGQGCGRRESWLWANKREDIVHKEQGTVCTWSCRICCSWSRSSATFRLMSSRLRWTAEVLAARGWLGGPRDSRVLRVFPPETWGVPMRKEQQRP